VITIEKLYDRLEQINDELKEAQERLEGLERDVSWIKKLLFLILGAILSVLVKMFFP